MSFAKLPRMILQLPCRILISFLLLTCLYGCKKESFKNNGIITGYDPRDCPCCGGLMINFRGETESFRGEFYLIQNSPSELGIDSSSKFPIYISVDWVAEGCTSGGLGNLIRITKSKRR